MLGCSLWLGSWLRGAATDAETIHALGALAPDAPPAEVLGAVRARGADRCWLLLPRPGRAPGWPRDAPGPPEPALLLCHGEALVGLLRGPVAGWRIDPATQVSIGPLAAAALSSGAAARALTAALVSGAEDLERLGLARAPGQAMPGQWQAALASHPRGIEPAALAVLARATTVLDALDLAMGTDGASVTAAEARALAGALVVVRDAVVDVVVGVVGRQYGLAGSVSP
jgi:hypothetical protein